MARTPFAPGRLLFGGDYNPEQWSEEVWDEDIALMKRARVNTVTIGVFSWAVLEPREGEYETGWLDAIIDRLTAAGIGFFLATPTASPPPWFTLAHPDALPVRADGTRVMHGSRDTYAISAPAYREASRRIARFLVERYGEHPGLAGWHIHNEYGTIDYGPHAARAFRTWLQKRYGTLERLNTAWYSAFWSQRYGSWEEILPPVQTQYLHNPAQAVDFKRFNSDEMLDAYREQKAEILAAGSRAPITTNFMLPTWNHLEQWSWSDEQDVVSLDHYLDDAGIDGEAHVAYGSDLARSWSDGPWVLMEQNATGIRLGSHTATKTPEQTIRNSLSYIAHGSQSSLFFQWRAGAGGSEQWHGALVPHAGADSEAWATVEELGEILERISSVAEVPTDGRIVDAEIGIVWDANGWWSLETPHLPNDEIRYSDEVRSVHRSLWRAGRMVDFVRPRSDASRYRVLFAPALYAIDAETAQWLEEYVHAGGHLVVGILSGIADEHQQIVPGGYPGVLRALVGVRSDEIRPLADADWIELSDGSRATQWTQSVQLEDAEALVSYASGAFAGRPAITRSRRGEGTTTYISTALVQESKDAVVQRIVDEAGVEPVLSGAIALGVEAVRRRTAGGDVLFLLHHGSAAVRVRGHGTDLISGRSDEVIVEPGRCAVIQESGREWSIELVAE